MRKYRNFNEYMEDKYYNDLFKAVKPLVYRDKDSFEDGEITYVKFVEAEDIHVEGTTFKDLGNNRLEIRTTVDVDVRVEGKAGRDYDTFSSSRMYCVFFSGILDDILHDVKYLRAEQYSENQFERGKSLSQDLVPYLYEEDVEKEAEDFLRRHFPKALLQPMKIPAEEVAIAMGMQFYYAPLEDNVFGKTYFGCETVTVYDSILKKNPHEITTVPGTMLVNPDVYFMYNLGTANNTIIHECVHWDRHRRAFALQRILHGESSHISCERIDKYEGIPQDASSLQWMEWQANQLAPRILMPRTAVKQVFKNMLSQVHAEHPTWRNAVVLDDAVGRFALYFEVSYMSAKIRLIECGFDSVQGAHVYCDGMNMPPFSFPDGTLKINQSFVIDENNAMMAILLSPSLRTLFFEGKIIYANCMVCINDPKYVMDNEHGVPILTDYALEHVDECCFIFNCKISASNKYSDSYYRRCFLCRDVSADTMLEAEYDPEHKNNQDKEQAKAELTKIANMINSVNSAMNNEIPSGFAGTLSYHMDKKDLTNELLAERTHLSTTTISKYKNNTEVSPDIGKALALCNGLKLQRDYAHDFMKKSNNDLSVPSQKHMAAKFLIDYHMDDTLEQWQEKLDVMKIDIQLP